MRSWLPGALIALTLALLLVASCAGPTATPTTPPGKAAPTSTVQSAATVPPAASPVKPAASPAAASPTAASAVAGVTVNVTANPKLGNILTDAKGLTLYTYKNDQPNVSNCYGPCAQNWPPLTVTGTPVAPPGFSGELGTITRTDGTKQVTYNQAPLYYFARDAQAGDTNGQGIGGVWSVAQPNAP